MDTRLTKLSRWRKAIAAAFAVSCATHAGANPLAEAADLRDCIAQARDAAAVAACERTGQAVLKARIARWSDALRPLLDDRQRQLFERNEKAWQAFVDSELEMLDMSLATRRDGLAPRLRPGAITRLYEERERQVREHLHNLTAGTGGAR